LRAESNSLEQARLSSHTKSVKMLESVYYREWNRHGPPRPPFAISEQEQFAGVIELDEILSAIRIFNDNSYFISGQRGRKRELDSPPIAIKTATDEFLVLQLNAPRIVGGVLRCFVHQPKQGSNEPAKGKEETEAHYVLVCCIIII
jgi:hypothetical protein